MVIFASQLGRTPWFWNCLSDIVWCNLLWFVLVPDENLQVWPLNDEAWFISAVLLQIQKHYPANKTELFLCAEFVLCWTKKNLSCLFWCHREYIFFCLHVSVHGSPAAAPHACQAPTGPDLPAPRPSETYPPLHLHSGRVFGPPLDSQVHWSCHCFPCHGESWLICSSTQTELSLSFTFHFNLFL